MAGVSGAVNDMDRIDVVDCRGIELGIIWCWSRVDVGRVFAVIVVSALSRPCGLVAFGYGAKLRDVGRFVR